MAQLQNTQAAGFTEANLNALGSLYGQDFRHADRYWIEREVNKVLVRTWPEMFTDMTLLFQKTPKFKQSDEFEYNTNSYDRKGFTVTVATAAVVSPNTVTVSVASVADIAFTDMSVNCGNQSLATVVNINYQANTIELKPMTNRGIPAMSVGQILPFVAPVEADGAKTINFRYRMLPQRQHNYIMLISGMIEYTMLELQKQQNNSYIPDFLNQEFENLVLHIRNSMSNMFWQGIRGEFTLADGRVAKSCMGIDEFITNGGNIVNTPVSSFGDAVENAVLASQFGSQGQRKFLYTTPRRATDLQKQYKNAATLRFQLQDKATNVNLELDEYQFGAGTVVVIPFQRFQDTASFPAEYQDFAYLLDHNLIDPVKLQNWADTGQTPDRKSGPYLLMSTQRWISDSMSTEMYNPLAHSKIIIS